MEAVAGVPSSKEQQQRSTAAGAVQSNQSLQRLKLVGSLVSGGRHFDEHVLCGGVGAAAAATARSPN